MMTSDERRLIEDLFAKLAAVERQGPPRDADAEAFIEDMARRQPGAAYYMSQTIVMQEQALEAAQARIEELERSRSSQGGGLLGALFGGGQQRPARPARRRPEAYDESYRDPRQARGGGFLAGAAQTAMGVAGGVLLGNMIAGAFMGDEASAAEADMGEDPGADTGGDLGGGFDMGDL
jgi:hypothetical protein